jgi:hypothetical protein
MPILKSRKFWIAVFDVVISCLTYFIPEYTDPILGNHILWLIAAWQPIFYALIVGTTQEDVALKKLGLVYDPKLKAYRSISDTESRISA